MYHHLRNAVSAVLITVASLLLPFGVLAAWASYGMADTGRYVTTMAPLADDPAVREAVAELVGAGIMDEMRDRADGGGNAGPSAGTDTGADAGTYEEPLPDSAQPFVRAAVRSFTRTDAYRTAWDTGNRAAHEEVLRALREDRHSAVTVDLAPVTAQVKERLSEDGVLFADRIPVRHTTVAVLGSGDLAKLRKGYHVLEVAGFWLPVAAVTLAASGIALAVSRRRAITATALGTALGGALLGASLLIGRGLVLDDLPAGVSRPAAAAVYDALTGTLRTVAWLLLTLGLTVALATWLTRRYGLRARRRRGSGPPASGPTPEPTRARV